MIQLHILRHRLIVLAFIHILKVNIRKLNFGAFGAGVFFADFAKAPFVLVIFSREPVTMYGEFVNVRHPAGADG